MPRFSICHIAAASTALAIVPAALAQETPLSPAELEKQTQIARDLGARFDVVDSSFTGTSAERVAAFAESLRLRGNNLPNIVLTGYWPPTNEMLRPWSPNPDQNGGMYIGENWEGRGYNVISFFPEFPNGLGQGVGDFEVDYQDTTGDWEVLVPVLEPVAIITTSRANTSRGWEVETKRINRENWSSDYTSPFQPTPTPPDDTVPVDHIRFASLPLQQIVDDVAASAANVDPFIADDFGGSFLSSYIGYFGIWECESHMAAGDPARCYLAGHIHVGRLTDVPDATLATEVTLRTVISELNGLLCPADLDGDGIVGSPDLGILLGSWGMPGAADFDGSGAVDSNDLSEMLGSWGACN